MQSRPNFKMSNPCKVPLKSISLLTIFQRVGLRGLLDDLHTHLLSSSSTRSPRQVQFTFPCGVRRQRSPQPPFMCRQGDCSPSITIKQNWLGGQEKSRDKNLPGCAPSLSLRSHQPQMFNPFMDLSSQAAQRFSFQPRPSPLLVQSAIFKENTNIIFSFYHRLDGFSLNGWKKQEKLLLLESEGLHTKIALCSLS